jgi:hypothetical protein
MGLLSSSHPQLLLISMQFHYSCVIQLYTIQRRLIANALISLSCGTMQVATWTALLLELGVLVHGLATQEILCRWVPVNTLLFIAKIAH